MTDFFRRLDAELIRANIWGYAARRLKEELQDHYLTEKSFLLAQGDSEAEADERALERLGDPVQLAQKARTELDRHDRNWKSQLFIRLMPLAGGVGAYCTAVGTIWAFFAWVHIFNWKVRSPQGAEDAFLVFTSIFVVWHLIPWLAIYLWILRTCYSPRYKWGAILVLSGYATLSCYLCTTWILFTSDSANFYFHPAISNALHLALVIFLLITPWRVRAQKLIRVGSA